MKNLLSYNQLKKKGLDYITYEDLLLTEEWQDKRKRILERDNNKCIKCNTKPTEYDAGKYWADYTEEELVEIRKQIKKDEEDFNKDSEIHFKFAVPIGDPTEDPIFLHVHHKYYIFRNLPWEYKNSALVTLCHKCHSKIHEKEKVSVYADELLNEKLSLTACPRCNGAGFFPQYSHVQSGICFECGGKKFVEFINTNNTL